MQRPCGHIAVREAVAINVFSRNVAMSLSCIHGHWEDIFPGTGGGEAIEHGICQGIFQWIAAHGSKRKKHAIDR